MSDDRVGGSVHKAESYWQNVVSQKVLSLNKVRIDEGVGRSGVHEGFKVCVRNRVRSEREYE